MRSIPVRIAVTTAFVVITGAVGGVMGIGPASAAVVPTLAVTTAGSADWTITYDTGAGPHTDGRCTVVVDSRTLVRDGTERTLTLPGSAVRPGRHPVRVRCGAATSPTLWIHAPRGQINDIGTWASNTTAGVLGI